MAALLNRDLRVNDRIAMIGGFWLIIGGMIANWPTPSTPNPLPPPQPLRINIEPPYVEPPPLPPPPALCKPVEIVLPCGGQEL